MTPNFDLKEFLNPGDPLPDDLILANLDSVANRLQVIRDLIQLPIQITSGYRTPEHNKKVGGSPNSYHLKGMAADIVVLGMGAIEVQQFLDNWSGGIGEYGTFTHLDIGPRRRWSN